MNVPSPCKDCGRNLFGPVHFCPFCGLDIAKQAEQSKAPVPPHDNAIQDKCTEQESGEHSEVIPNSTPLPETEDKKESASPDPEPLQASIQQEKTSFDNSQKTTKPAKKQVPGEHEAIVSPVKSPEQGKKSTGLFIGIALIVVVVAVITIKLIGTFSKPPAAVSKPGPAATAVNNDRSGMVKIPQKSVKVSTPASKTPPVKQTIKSVVKSAEKPLDERIQDAIALYENGKITEAAGKFKSILEVVPNNSVAKFYLQKCQDAGGP